MPTKLFFELDRNKQMKIIIVGRSEIATYGFYYRLLEDITVDNFI